MNRKSVVAIAIIVLCAIDQIADILDR